MANRGKADVELGALNQQQAAWLLGVTSRTLRDWPDAPRCADGSYDGRALVAWAVARSGGSENTEHPTQRERLAAAQAEKVEAENRVRRGELVEIEQTAQGWDDIVLATRAKLLSLPTKLAPQLVRQSDPNAISRAIADEIDHALAELAREDGADDAALRTTAETDGFAVGGPVPEAF